MTNTEGADPIHFEMTPAGTAKVKAFLAARSAQTTDCPNHPGTDHDSYDNRTRFEKDTATS